MSEYRIQGMSIDKYIPCCRCTRKRGHPMTTSPPLTSSRVLCRLLVPNTPEFRICLSIVSQGRNQTQRSSRVSKHSTQTSGTLTKSAKCMCPSESNNTLSGLTSRCIIPCLCIYLKAQPNSAIQNRTASSVKVFLEIWNLKSPPFIRSTTRYL